MASKGSICVLVSGGLDSDVLLASLARRYRHLYPVYVQQGLAWEAVELYWLRRFLLALRRRPEMKGRIEPLTLLRLPMTDLYHGHWSLGGRPVPGKGSRDAAVYLPGRNLALSLKAAVLCSLKRISVIAVGSLAHNPFPDATPAFYRLWSRALSSGLGHPVRLLAPFRQRRKSAVIRQGKKWPLDLSFSCIAPRGRLHCGRCNKCAERQKAFKDAVVEDQTRYAN